VPRRRVLQALGAGVLLAVVLAGPSAAGETDPLTRRMLDLIRRFDALESRISTIERGAR
jgi:hypothetical protein